MNLLYRLLKILCRITIFSYFKELEITGKENLKEKEPIIVVSNHPSTFMDPVVLAVIVRFELYFLAAAEYLGKGILKTFFIRFLNMIPIYRKQTKPGETHKNKDIFEFCYNHLNKRKSLLIFPEGVSITSNQLQPLKTGVARIAIGAENRSTVELGIKILPIGLNYSNPHEFRSNLLVNIGKPITVNEVIAQTDNFNEQVDLVMHEVRSELEKNLLHTTEADDSEFLIKLNELLHFLQMTDPSSEKEKFSTIKRLDEFLGHFSEGEKKEVNRFRTEIDAFFVFIKAQRIDLRAWHLERKINSLKNLAILCFGFPIFSFGLIINYLPYRLTGWIHDKLKIETTFSGALSLSIGMVLFLLWYILITIVSGIWYLGNWAILVPFFSYSLGIYALLYSNLRATRKRVNRTLKKLRTNNEVQSEFNSRLNVLKKMISFFRDQLITKNLV